MSNCLQELSSTKPSLSGILTDDITNEDIEHTVLEMKYEEKEKHCRALTILGWLNVIICQWLLFRITHYTDVNNDNRYGIIFPILPLTGWGESGFVPKRHFVVTRNPKQHE